MALSKEILKESGLTTTYHRIVKIALNYNRNQSIISVEDYVSEEYRTKAKKAEDIRQQINALFKQLETTSDQNLILAVSNKIQETQFANADLLNGNYAVSINDINLDYIPEDTTYAGFYEELKKLDQYKGADFI